MAEKGLYNRYYRYAMSDKTPAPIYIVLTIKWATDGICVHVHGRFLKTHKPKRSSDKLTGTRCQSAIDKLSDSMNLSQFAIHKMWKEATR